jgi:hypothetical protein
VILRFFAMLGTEYSMFESCKRITFPDDFLWLGLLMFAMLALTFRLREV